MKICHLVLGKGNPERANGINRIAHELCVAQRLIGLDTEMWGWTPDPEAQTSVRPYPLRLQRRAPLRFAPALGFSAALKQLPNCSVFHFHGALLPEWSAAARVLRARKIPWVITPHGSWTQAALRRSPRRKRAFLSLFDRSLAEDALAVQVNGEAERVDALSLFPSANVIVVPNGQAQLPQPAPQTGLRFVFCGRLDIEHKGLDILIDGFLEHLARGGEGDLLLIGEGADHAKLAARAEPAGDRIRFLGARFGDSKLAEIGSASLFLHSSRHEGMPMAVLEAAALARPLALSDGTNLLGDFEGADACLPIRPNTPESIATVLRRACELHAEDRLASLGERARSLVEEKFTWEGSAQSLLEQAYSLHPDESEVAA